MAGETPSLFEETQAALKSSRPSPPPVGQVLQDRRRLVPFIVVGASLLGVTVGIIVGQIRGDARGPLATGALGGIAIGTAVGWLVLGLGHLVAGDRHLGWAPLLFLRIVLSIPPYLAAGIGATLIPTALTGGAVPVTRLIGAAFTALMWGAIILYPLSFAMARSRQGAVLRATTLRGAIDETIHESEHGSALGRTSGLAIIVVVWLIGTIAVLLSGLAFLQSLDRFRYAAAFDAYGSLIGPLILVAITGMIVGGSMVTNGVVFGRRETSQRARKRRRR